MEEINVKTINDPKFLKTLSYKELNLLCANIREEIINATSVNGGHVASNLGVVELTVALHRTFDFSKDKLLLDVGHQCYTHKILTGRSLDKLRKKDGISGFQKRNESIYDCFEAGHSSTSISTALGMAVARDLNKENYDIVAVIGDGSVTSGLAFEGLNNLGHLNNKVIIVLNDNDMSISKPTGGFARFLQRIRTSVSYNRKKKSYQRFMCKTRFGLWLYNISSHIKNTFKKMFLSSNIFDTMGFAYIGPIDGHNIKAMEKALKQAQKASRSVVIHMQTIKGKGYKYSEEDHLGIWHGVPPFDKDTGIFKCNQATCWSQAIANDLDEILAKNEKTVLINPAMVQGSCLNEVFKKYKGRTFDVGICEEHAFTMASGLALSGYHPIISIYSTFMQRAYDEIQQDLARMNLNVTITIDRAGLVGADGETHQGIFDEAMLYTIPNTVITMPSNNEEAKILLNESLNNHGTFAIRFPKAKICSANNNVLSFNFGEWLKVTNTKSNDVIVSFGPIINDLKEQISNIDIINAIYQKPILDDNIKHILNYKRVILYNPYGTIDGFINNFIEKLTLYNYRGVIKVVAIKQDFIKASSQIEQMVDTHVAIEDLIKVINSDKEV